MNFRRGHGIRLLETVAEHAADDFAWPAPFTLEMQSCGFPNARWDLATKKLTLCYELAREFADLYRDYGDVRTDGTRIADSSKAKNDRRDGIQTKPPANPSQTQDHP